MIISFLLSATPIFASPVSLLQETKHIECLVPEGNKNIKSLWIDKKDYLLKITNVDKSVEEYEQLKFLDRGILAQSKADPQKIIFFQILNNGDTRVHQGQLFNFKEADCEDTGASKKCKNPGFGTLEWTPERLGLKGSKLKRNVEIKHYGFFPNKATFVLGVETKAMNLGYPSLLLLDYGAPLEMLVGHTSRLNCSYSQGNN